MFPWGPDDVAPDWGELILAVAVAIACLAMIAFGYY